MARRQRTIEAAVDREPAWPSETDRLWHRLDPIIQATVDAAQAADRAADQ